MQNNSSRQAAILDIIEKVRIYSQEDFIEKLAQRGIVASQATLSRDLKALHVKRVPGEGYVVQKKVRHTMPEEIQGNVSSIEFSGQLAVIKTHLGFAPALAAYMDKHSLEPIMGTIAGDDTLLLIIRQGYSHQQTLSAISLVFPDIMDRLIVQE